MENKFETKKFAPVALKFLSISLVTIWRKVGNFTFMTKFTPNNNGKKKTIIYLFSWQDHSKVQILSAFIQQTSKSHPWVWREHWTLQLTQEDNVYNNISQGKNELVDCSKDLRNYNLTKNLRCISVLCGKNWGPKIVTLTLQICFQRHKLQFLWNFFFKKTLKLLTCCIDKKE